MPVKLIQKNFMEYVCDVCKHKCWFDTNSTPKGWGTSRDDYQDTFCPDCNPWVKHNKDPDLEKLNKVKESTKHLLDEQKFK